MSCGEARQRTAEKAADRNILQNVEKRHIDKIGVAAIVHILCREALISCAGWQRKFENSIGLLMYASVTHDAGNCFRKSRFPARKRKKPCIHKRIFGKSIDERPAKAAARDTFGHWESDTVVGRKRAGEAAVFTIVERLTGYYISIRIDGKNTAGVADAMEQLKAQYGEKFSQVFRSITTDNGSEFASFDKFEASGISIYFAHPYTSCERPVNRNQRYSQKTAGLSHSG